MTELNSFDILFSIAFKLQMILLLNGNVLVQNILHFPFWTLHFNIKGDDVLLQMFFLWNCKSFSVLKTFAHTVQDLTIGKTCEAAYENNNSCLRI